MENLEIIEPSEELKQYAKDLQELQQRLFDQLGIPTERMGEEKAPNVTGVKKVKD